MRGSIKLFRVFGIQISAHWSFFALVLLIILAEHSYGTGAILFGLIWLSALFFSVIFHELAHSLVAKHQQLKIHGIVLLPIGGASMIENIDRDPSTEFKVAFIGPLSSFFLGGIGLLLAKLLGGVILPISLFNLNGTPNGIGSFLAELGWTNIALGIFNLIPAFPMDGGRVLRASLEHFMDPYKARSYVVGTSRFLSVAMIVFGLLYGDIFLAIIGMFLFVSAGSQYIATQRHADNKLNGQFIYNHGLQPTIYQATVADVMLPDPRYLDGSIDAYQAAPWVIAEGRYFPVFLNGYYVGMIGPAQLKRAVAGQSIYELTIKGVPILSPQTPVVPIALNIWHQLNGIDLPVFDNGRLVGVFSADKFANNATFVSPQIRYFTN